MDEFNEQDYIEYDDERSDRDGWDLSDEEMRENGDYIAELRFGGDARSDREIKEAVYESMREDDDYFNDWEDYS